MKMHSRKKRHAIFAVGLWALLFGVWPFMNTGHASLAGVGDLLVHAIGFRMAWIARPPILAAWGTAPSERE